jgi:hypothetical protein
MAYFKINDIDFSMYVNALKVNKNRVYTSQTNAVGNSVVDYINTKKTIEVGIIPLTTVSMNKLITELDKFNVVITYLDPKENKIESIECIIPAENIEYYTIQADKVLFKAFTLSFTEL